MPSSEWDELYFATVWPEWKDSIKEKMREKITTIGL